jgi:multimeric flavodoxin WrbA
MKKILAINGSPRPAGNTVHLLQSFADGCRSSGCEPEIVAAHELHIHACTGCLRCNILKRCSLRGDDWEHLATRVLEADVLVFATPVYFHHLPGTLKGILDRFRSFSHIQVSEKGLIHTPHQKWDKDFVLILSQGSPDPADARPIVDLFTYICKIMGKGNQLHVVPTTGLSLVNQVVKTEEELGAAYRKLGLPERLVPEHHRQNRHFLDSAYELGESIASSYHNNH